MKVTVGDVELEYETTGDRTSPAALLINGLGGQLIAWPPPMVARLAERGLYVIRFDNRDAGLSSDFADRPQYTLDDMAADAVGLLDSLGVERAHVVGASMGGMIAQLVAINHPERVLSLTSIMSNLGFPDVEAGKPEAVEALSRAAPAGRAELIDQAVGVWTVMAGGHPIDEDLTRRSAAAAFDRAFRPDGRARQYKAVLSAPSRREALGRVAVPALVIHGVDDPLVVVENGRRTAAALPGARLLEIEGMGHNYPRHTWEPIADAIADLAGR